MIILLANIPAFTGASRLHTQSFHEWTKTSGVVLKKTTKKHYYSGKKMFLHCWFICNIYLNDKK